MKKEAFKVLLDDMGTPDRNIEKVIDLTEHMAQVCYGKSSKIDHEDNQNEYWQDGYKIGMISRDTIVSDTFNDEKDGWNPNDFGWKEWKRGYWSGRYTAFQDKELFGDEEK